MTDQGPSAPRGPQGEQLQPPRRVKVSDKRRSAAPESSEQSAGGDVPEEQATAKEASQYLDDLKRLQAEFDNYRKRMMREQSEIGRHSISDLLKKLLPVLDNFERAAAHDADSRSLGLLRKDLLAVLAAEGLEEIPAENEPFDPHVHEAVESHEQDGVDEPTCVSVYRTGYRFGGKVLRPAMVVVARPLEKSEDAPEDAASG